jgi:excisionase family DNA binding protein
MADKLLTFNQVATFYAVTPRTVRNWADKGAIPVVRTPGGQPRVPSTAVSTKSSETDGNAGV